MKKIVTITIAIIGLMCFAACSSNENVSVELHEIDSNVTVKQSIEENWYWDGFDINNIDYSVFPLWEDGKQLKQRLALLYNKNPMKDGTMNVCLVYFEDTMEQDDNFSYMFNCPGVYVSSIDGGLKDGDTFVFGPLPIAEPDGELRDIHVGYSEDGWFDVNGTKIKCNSSGLIMHATQHGESWEGDN
ncbi:MAG: hypothetical protein IJA01_03265 [Firmicutes bacterium]|nr:hypothetical protein [Bacillota bacterium]